VPSSGFVISVNPDSELGLRQAYRLPAELTQREYFEDLAEQIAQIRITVASGTCFCLGQVSQEAPDRDWSFLLSGNCPCDTNFERVIWFVTIHARCRSE
jgi:hypothetical protein